MWYFNLFNNFVELVHFSSKINNNHLTPKRQGGIKMKEFVVKTLWQEKSIISCYYLVLITTFIAIYGIYSLYGVVISINGAMIFGVVFGAMRCLVEALAESASGKRRENGLLSIPVLILEATTLAFVISVSNDIGIGFFPRTVGVILGCELSFVIGFIVIAMIFSITSD